MLLHFFSANLSSSIFLCFSLASRPLDGHTTRGPTGVRSSNKQPAKVKEKVQECEEEKEQLTQKIKQTRAKVAKNDPAVRSLFLL